MSRPRQRGELTGGDAFSKLIGKRRQSAQVETHVEDADDQRKRTAPQDDAKNQRPQATETRGDDGLRVQVKKEPAFEETHTRATFWIPNDLLGELDAFSTKTGLSKSQIVSRATRYFIEHAEIED